MDFIGELLGQVLVELFWFPGAYIFYLFNPKKRGFKKFYKEKPLPCFISGILFWVILILLIVYL